ncbi:hypothetical protein VTO42DRAFT_7774 [Malbranchea cinnamomea]
MALPCELHIHLISFLSFPDLQMLRATNTYFRNLPTETEIARARAEYVRVLRETEFNEVKGCTGMALENGNGSSAQNPQIDQYLTCYTCFRRRHENNFANTQITRRRTKGHADAHKRFCKDCAIRGNKWEPGITLSFPYGDVIYCRRCRDIKPPPHNEWLKVFGLCEDCRVRTKVPDIHPAKEGITAALWYGTKEVFTNLYKKNPHARIPVPESEWNHVELVMGMLQVDPELLSHPEW